MRRRLVLIKIYRVWCEAFDRFISAVRHRPLRQHR